MTNRNYSPTVNPGDKRTRTRYIGIWIPNNGTNTLDVLEQEVIKTSDGSEEIIKDLNGLSIKLDNDALFTQYMLRNPIDDSIISGQTVTPALAQQIIYSVIRGMQLSRDVAEDAAGQQS
jgi:hypothetical protein